MPSTQPHITGKNACATQRHASAEADPTGYELSFPSLCPLWLFFRKPACPRAETVAMRWVTAHRRQLLIQEKRAEIAWPQRSLAFEESITDRAVHELLFQPSPGGGFPFFPALLAARAAVARGTEASGLAP